MKARTFLLILLVFILTACSSPEAAEPDVFDSSVSDAHEETSAQQTASEESVVATRVAATVAAISGEEPTTAGQSVAPSELVEPLTPIPQYDIVDTTEIEVSPVVELSAESNDTAVTFEFGDATATPSAEDQPIVSETTLTFEGLDPCFQYPTDMSNWPGPTVTFYAGGTVSITLELMQHCALLEAWRDTKAWQDPTNNSFEVVYSVYTNLYGESLYTLHEVRFEGANIWQDGDEVTLRSMNALELFTFEKYPEMFQSNLISSNKWSSQETNARSEAYSNFVSDPENNVAVLLKDESTFGYRVVSQSGEPLAVVSPHGFGNLVMYPEDGLYTIQYDPTESCFNAQGQFATDLNSCDWQTYGSGTLTDYGGVICLPPYHASPQFISCGKPPEWSAGLLTHFNALATENVDEALLLELLN